MIKNNNKKGMSTFKKDNKHIKVMFAQLCIASRQSETMEKIAFNSVKSIYFGNIY